MHDRKEDIVLTMATEIEAISSFCAPQNMQQNMHF